MSVPAIMDYTNCHSTALPAAPTGALIRITTRYQHISQCLVAEVPRSNAFRPKIVSYRIFVYRRLANGRMAHCMFVINYP